MLSLGLGLGLTQTRAGGSRWTPAAIFGPSDTGVLFDARDLRTLFLTSAGITNVSTPGQPSGLVLDKSKGLALGPEVLSNGDFSNDLTGWLDPDGHWSAVGGGAYHASTSNFSMLLGDVSASAGKYSQLAFKVSGYGGAAGLRVQFRLADQSVITSPSPFSDYAGSSNPAIRADGTYTWRGVVPATAKYISFARDVFGGGSAEFTIDSVSLRDVVGFHGAQPTAGARPTYQSTGLSFDGSDDRLMTTFKPGLSGTIMSRFNGDAPNRALLGCTLGPNGHARLVLDSSGRLAAGVGLQSASVLSAGPDLRNAWHAGAVSWDGTTVKLYLDGSEVYSDAQVGSVNTTVDMAIGALNSGGTATGFWSGQISDALVIDRAATPAEILKLHNHWSA
ncbi:LamG-like jellyroll fold domain-containing protein [Pararhodobacter zhoushanensis]|uniref:LamG-like jellyroll fold domain-containing protein n=1 Tax=Pararhodobacter zhoushanensis TaxID=2479545 RepID=UPI000F8D9731|nr:LamG-like jellyroll fold domain-containing protein [Pararhodobacter zhoushanensis]